MKGWFVRSVAVLLGATAAAEQPPAITYAIRPPGLIRGQAADLRGNVYIVGEPNMSFRATPGVAYTTRPSGRASYLVKLDPEGNVVFATFLPGSGSNIAVDQSGRAYFMVGRETDDPISAAPYLAMADADGSRVRFHSVPAFGRIALDGADNLYIATASSFAPLPVTSNALQQRPAGAADMHITKLNPRTGAILYGTYLGGSGDDTGMAFFVDAAGNAFVAGRTQSTDFPVTPSAYQVAAPQKAEYGFVAKLNPQGSALVYSTYFEESVWSLAVGSDGAALLAHGYISKLSPDGSSRLWTTSLACCHAVAVDPAGSAVALGSILQPDFPEIQPLQAERGNPVVATCRFENPLRFSNCSDVALAKFDPDGKVLWSSSLGGPLNDQGGRTMVDGWGNVYAYMSGFTGFPLPGMSGSGDSVIKIEPVGPPPLLKRSAIVSSAGFKPRISAGGLVSLFGTGLTNVQGVVTAPSFPLPTTLEDTSVWFGDRPAPILAVANVNGQEQVNVQVPAANPEDFNTWPGSVITVRKGRALGFAFSGYYHGVGSIFTDAGGRPAVTHADFSLVSSENPARAGETILVFATGLGWVSPPVPEGQPAPASPLSRTVATPVVRIGGQTATVAFSGLTPGLVGLYQINVMVPALPPGEAALEIGPAGSAHDTVRIAVQ